MSTDDDTRDDEPETDPDEVALGDPEREQSPLRIEEQELDDLGDEG